MAFNSTPPRAEYVATSGQTVFPYLFKVYEETDIVIYQQTGSSAAVQLTLTTDYTVSINGDAGGEVTLVSGAVLGDNITLLRSLPVTRDVEYQTSGDLLADTLNMDQEYQTYLMSDSSQEDNLKMTFTSSESGVSNIMPTPEALKLLRWNTAANALENTTITVGADEVYINIYNVNTIAEMLLLDESLYPTVNVRGYYAANDGGGGLFNYDSLQSATNNGGTIIDGWVRQYSGNEVNDKWFGAKLNTDITTIAQNMIDNFDEVRFTTNAIISTVSLRDSMTIFIDSELTFSHTASCVILNGIFGTKIIFNGKGKMIGDGASANQSCIELTDCVSCKVINPFIEDFRNKGVVIIGASTNNLILKPRVRGATGVTGAGIALSGALTNYNTVSYADCSSNRIGITINGAHYNDIIHPIANQCTASGVSIDGIITDSGDGGKYNKIDHPICNNGTNATYGGVFCGNGSNYNEIISPVCNNNAGAGIRFSGGSGYENIGNSIVDAVCNSNAINGMTFSFCPQMTLVNPATVGNTGKGIADLDCDGLKIIGGFIDNNSSAGIIHQSPRTIDDNVTITNNGTYGAQIAFGGSLGLGSNITKGCYILGNTTAPYLSAGGSKAIDCQGFITNNSGSDNKADGQTIAHGLSGTPLRVDATTTSSGEFVSVTAVTATTFTVAIKDHTGAAGSTQAIYWEASLY